MFNSYFFANGISYFTITLGIFFGVQVIDLILDWWLGVWSAKTYGDSVMFYILIYGMFSVIIIT